MIPVRDSAPVLPHIEDVRRNTELQRSLANAVPVQLVIHFKTLHQKFMTARTICYLADITKCNRCSGDNLLHFVIARFHFQNDFNEIYNAI